MMGARGILVAAAAGLLAWPAAGQEPEGGFILKVKGVAKPTSPVVEVEVWAWYEEGPEAEAFGYAVFDLHADDASGEWVDYRCPDHPTLQITWCGRSSQPVLAGSVIHVTVGQPGPPFFTPTRETPVHVFTGLWAANEYTPRTVPVETVNTIFGVFDSNYGLRVLQSVSPGVGEIRVCYADCDESGALDFFDFLCFQNAFLAQDPYADCDGDGQLTFFDFLCFQDEFLAGCP